MSKSPTQEDTIKLDTTGKLFNRLRAQLEEELSKSDFHAVWVVGKEIAKTGCTTKDACTVNDIDVELFEELIAQNQKVKSYLERMEKKYENNLLAAIGSIAQTKGGEVAQRVLVNRYPEKYGSKRNDEEVRDDVRDILNTIRFGGDSKPIHTFKEKEGEDTEFDKALDSLTKALV